MSMVAALFQEVVTAISKSEYHQGGVNFLYYDKGVFACGKGSGIPKDAIRIVNLNQWDFDKGLSSEKWSQVHKKLNDLIAGEVVKCQLSQS